MKKKSLPILILVLIVIICIAILVQSLAAPAQPSASAPASTALTASSSVAALPQGQNQPASATSYIVYSPDIYRTISIRAPGGIITAEVASSSEQQAKGLGGRASLQSSHGMIFPFTYPGDYGFWMKDMHFPLDMVWISSNEKVVGVTAGISPDTYPTVFYPPLAISYVLELNAGDADRFGIATDTQLEF